ncbi:MAG: MFS transporter [Candidatus Goldbacteria bacterium]|nr:MFS transporter [Candidatus Goldiibacteriota bacterium]HPD18219.1 MFS transporter [Candidatus Goldiibacteriota bacterium]
MTDDTKKAFQLIFLFGFVSLFGDIVYEGARAVNGPYLKSLAVNASVVGLIVGIGEFAGYALRLITGYFADKTRAYWVFTFIGYGLIISIPMLSLTGVWQIAAVLMVTERLGKGIRAPAKDTIVSSAAKRIGTGKGFAIQEVMDQFGALIGPLIFTAYFALTGGGVKNAQDYRNAYALFWIPYLLVMIFVVIAFLNVSNPSKLEPLKKENEPDKITPLFWIYNIFSFVTALGLLNFAIIGYHFKAKAIVSDAMIPVFYAIAMAVDGLAAFVMGMIYDKLKVKNNAGGMITLIVLPVFSILIPFFVFANSFVMALVASVLLGIVMGGQETIMKAAIADITPIKKRGTGYGIFNFSFGLAMFIGSYLAGLLYDISVTYLIWLIVALQIVALILFFVMKAEIDKNKTAAEKI